MRQVTQTALFLALVFLAGCTTREIDKPNQKQGSPSPSGRYVVNVPLERDAQKHAIYWRVTISDTNGLVLFKDDSEFVGQLNVYWFWDKSDRLWLRNSDNGNTYYWEVNKNGEWQRTQWLTDNRGSLAPPPELFPDYWQNRK